MLSSSANGSPQRKVHFQEPLQSSLNTPRRLETIPQNSTLQTNFGPTLPSKRLIVEHLVLENFKSYAGRQVVGPFHSSFTSIVGPNGSGKSNVIDAFMFVLGYRAKKLRQGKLSELIHNSDGMMDLEYCSVEVHFKVISQDESVGESLVVSRTAYRNSSNKYSINGQSSNYSEVTTLLKDFGVDLDHKRFLILQGEVESIAQMKAKAGNEHEEGLLEYLEDIIGTNKYIELIEETGKVVDLANDACAERNVRVRAAEREVAVLSQEKNNAETFIRQENELVIKKAEMYQVSRHESELQIQKLSEKLVEVQEKLAAEKANHDFKCNEAQELEQQLKDLANAHTKKDKEAAMAAKQLGQLEKEDVKMQETRKHLKSKIKNLAKTLTDDIKARSNIQREIADIEQEMQVLVGTIKTLEVDLQREEAELIVVTESLKGKTGQLQVQLEHLQKQLSPWTEKIRMEQDALEGAVLALSAFEKKQRTGEIELVESEARLISVKAELSSAQDNCQRLEQEREALAAEVKRLESEIAAGEELQDSLNSTVNSMQTTVAEANEALRQHTAGNAVLTALMREASEGRLPGVYGRLGDLGIIDGKYDVAVSTACYSLNYIVVEDTACGQKCVEFLRRNNLGRASFIILEKMRSVPKPVQLPSGASRLFDLVQARDVKFSPAFYFALNDTLVATNMQEASRMAYGDSRRRFRVVTLDGKLIDTSGTMSGGGNVQQQGGMKASFAPEISREQLNQLSALLGEKLVEQKQIKTGLMRYQELLSRARIDMKRVDVELGRLGIALKSLPTQITDLQQTISGLQRRSAQKSSSVEDVEKMNRLKAQVIQSESNIQELRDLAAPVQMALDACQAQILEAGGTRFKTQKTKVSDLRDQLRLQERRLHKITNQKMGLERRLESGDLQSEGESEMKLVEAELVALEGQIEGNTQSAFAAKQVCDAAISEVESLKEQIGALKGKNDYLIKELSKFRRIEFELKSEIEKHESSIEACKQTVSWAQSLLAQLRFNPICLDGLAPLEIPIFDEEDLKGRTKNLESLKSAIGKLEERLCQIQPNLKVIEEYRQREEEYRQQRQEYERLETERDIQRARYETLRRQRHDEFMTGFRQISLRLKELYQLITMGGNAELELVDSLDPFSEGILFSVMPPKKSWKNIANLSGGEKTLSSLALVFALHTFKPTPIYVMDEIDAALDFRNVSIVANYIKERTQNAQFIVISLRNNMFELADRLVGIYKTNQRTKSVTIDPATFSVGAFIQNGL